ncbi:MAG: nuclear transport factor 2 family protein [Paracoccaceae bacterium]
MNSADIVRGFWDAMRSNDFDAAAARWLAPDYVGLWPQSGEVARGPDAFARMNNVFPDQGNWRFEETSILADGPRVVSNMRVTNAGTGDVFHTITFHDVAEGRITRQTEYWPDPYEVPAWRMGLTEIDRETARW